MLEGPVQSSPPRPRPRILGAWYSDCGHHEKILAASLDSIAAAQKDAARAGVNVDVVTCCWRPLAFNPFPDLGAKHHLYCLFGISLQVLQILYDALDRGVEYLGASFLESDTLYPPLHFLDAAKVLLENPDALGASNMSYLGVRKDGYCRLNQLDQPTHQMTMRWPWCLEHFERVALMNLRRGQWCLEPDDKSRFVKFFGATPALHVNHNHHMTSHYNIYAQTAFERSIPGWGDYRRYYPEEWVDDTTALDSVDPLERKYQDLCRTPSAQNALLPILRKLAEQCEHVTEFGTYVCESAAALLSAHPKVLVTYDVIERGVGFLEQNAGATRFRFVRANVLEADIEETDMLYIDTTHTGWHVSRELERHCGKVRRFIAIHDVVTRRLTGCESVTDNPEWEHLDVMVPQWREVEGMGRAIEEFLAAHPEWSVREEVKFSNGLLILERKRGPAGFARSG